MILFLNVRVTAVLPDRHIQGEPTPTDGVEVFKYALASLAVIPFTHVFIYCDLAADCADQREEIDGFSRHLFPKATLYSYRNERQSQWEEAMRAVFAIQEQAGDELVWLCCDPTQVFIDYELGLLERIQARLLELHTTQRYVTCYLSPWPEIFPRVLSSNRETTNDPSEIVHEETTPEGFLVTWIRADGVQIVNRELLRHWWFAYDHGDAFMPQPHTPGGTTVLSPDNVFCLVPFRELVRSYHGFPAQEVDAGTYPPLSIPEGFFAGKLKVRYGYRRRKSGWLHINPQIAATVAADADGVDWVGGLKTLPLCWQSRIARVKTSLTPVDKTLEDYSWDQALLKAAVLYCHHLPVALMKHLRPVLRTTAPDLLGKLHREACEFVDHRIETLEADCKGYALVRYRHWYYALAHSLGRIDIPRLYAFAAIGVSENHEWFAGDDLAACREYISAYYALPCVANLHRCDVHHALCRPLSDYLSLTLGAGSESGLLGWPAIDTWVYLRLIRQIITAPERPVSYREIQAELKQMQALMPPMDSETLHALNTAYAQNGTLRFAQPAHFSHQNWAGQLNHRVNQPIEYTQLLAGATPSVSIALTTIQLDIALGNAAKAMAQLDNLLAGTVELPFDYVAVLCAHTALSWTISLFPDNLGVPSVQRVFTLLRDLNCRRLSTPGLQRAMVQALDLQNAAEQALAYNRIGEALFALEQDSGAEMAFQQACALPVPVAEVYNNLAVLCWNRGQQDEARAHLEHALRLDPTNAVAVVNLRALQVA